MKKWPSIAVNNPLITYLIFGLAMLSFVYSYMLMPQSEDPVLNLPIVGVGIIYPGASVADIESQVVEVVETAMNELDDVIEINTSIIEDVAYTEIEFQYGVDPTKIFDDVQAQVNIITSDLPDGIYETEVYKYSTTNVNVIQLAIISESVAYHELYAEAEALESQFQKSSVVSSIDILACPSEEVHILLDPSRMEYYNIHLDQIEQALQSYNAVIPGGKINVGQQVFKVRTSGSFKNLESIEQAVVGVNGQSLVHLKDLASVEVGYEAQNWIARHNGKPAIFLTVKMKSGSDIFQLKNDIDSHLQKHKFSEGISHAFVFDQSVGVDLRVNGFIGNLIQGIVLVGLLCLFVLGWRSSFLVMIAVPTSILAGLALTFYMGYSINQITIAGLVIALGLLVDDAIAVAENTKRYLKNGESLKSASIKGAKELVVPLFSGTVTTILAFIPIIMVPDITGAFIRPMPIAVIWTLLISSIVALVIIPLLSSTLPTRTKSINTETAASRRIQRLIDGSYTRFLYWTMQRRWLTIGIVTALLVGSFSMFSSIDIAFFPKAEKPLFRIEAELAQGSGLQMTEAVVEQIENILMSTPELDFVASNVGHGNPRVYYNMASKDYSSRYADILVGLKSYTPESFAAYLSKIRPLLHEIEGAEISIKEFAQGPSADAPVYIEIEGPELEKLKAYATQIESIMQGTKGIINIHNPVRHAAIDMRYVINKDKAIAQGIPLHLIDKTIRTMITGRPVTEYINEEGEKLPVILKHQSGGAVTIEDMEKVMVESWTGPSVKLSNLATLKLEEGLSNINHKNGERITFLEADLSADAILSETVALMRSQIDNLDWDEGYHYIFRGDVEAQAKSFGSMGFAALIAFLLIFGVLVIQFHSFIQPLIIFTALPFAIAGAIVLLALTSIPISFTGFVGFTSLIGIAINNTIVLIEFANRQIELGHDKISAIIKGAKVRFMPIMLTTLTTILGLLPLTLFGGALWKPMGWVIIGGMLSSTLLVLLVVPLMYVIVTREEQHITK